MGSVSPLLHSRCRSCLLGQGWDKDEQRWNAPALGIFSDADSHLWTLELRWWWNESSGSFPWLFLTQASPPHFGQDIHFSLEVALPSEDTP